MRTSDSVNLPTAVFYTAQEMTYGDGDGAGTIAQLPPIPTARLYDPIERGLQSFANGAAATGGRIVSGAARGAARGASSLAQGASGVRRRANAVRESVRRQYGARGRRRGDRRAAIAFVNEAIRNMDIGEATQRINENMDFLQAVDIDQYRTQMTQIPDRLSRSHVLEIRDMLTYFSDPRDYILNEARDYITQNTEHINAQGTQVVNALIANYEARLNQ
jgi:hypothetical protein